MHKSLPNVLFFCLCALLMAGCARDSNTPPPADVTSTATARPTITPIPTPTPYDKVPEQLDDGLATGSLAEAGIDGLRMSRMLERIYHGPESGDNLKMPNNCTKYEHIDSILVIKGSRLVFEEYFYHYDENNRHSAASVTKSITSLLVGQAIAEGVISSVEEKALAYFPEYEPSEAGMEEITLYDLLTMQHGIDCNDWNPDSPTYWQKSIIWRQEDVLAFLTSFGMETRPGSLFRYCSLSTIMLGGILARSSGMSVPEFANQHLFDPLGITAFWTTAPPLWTDTGGGLNITSRDMAKIGLMVLEGGQWQGQQVVPAEWLQVSTEAHATIWLEPGWGYQYGYLWWLSDVNIGGTMVHSISASGAGGQVITIYPELDMVVVITGSNYEDDQGYPFKLMENYILPAVVP